MGQDLRFGFRMLRKSPGFTLMAVLALALGIGANTAIFSVINAVLLQRLPFADPGRLAMVWDKSPQTGKANVVNPLNFLEWRARNHSFEALAALIAFPTSLAGGGEPEQVEGMWVSDGFFPILGIKPILGRWFTPQEDIRGNDHVAILSEGLWRRRYAADPNIIGHQIRVENQATTVVGVMPSSFRFPFNRTELWQPLAIDRTRSAKSGRFLSTVARLRPGVSLASAQAEMQIIGSQLEKERPDFNRKWGIIVTGLREQVVGDVRTPLIVLMAAVGLVLSIACANVANLMLMRAAGRGREIAIRSALGAGALRIARQLLVESALLAGLGGALGLLGGLWAVQALTTALPDSIRYVNLKEIRIDGTVFAFTFLISLASGILTGLAPVLRARRTSLTEALKEAGPNVAGGHGFARGSLVVAEVALSTILLIGAGLLLRSFARLASVSPGFDGSHALSMQLATAGRFPSNRQFLEFDQHLLDQVRALPGVEAAGTSHFLPLGRIIPATGFWRADRPAPPPSEAPVTEVLVTMPGYFAAMSIPLVRGRVLTEHDRAGAPLTVVVNQALAAKFYPDEDPVGKHIYLEWNHPDQPYEIVGVVGDVRQQALNREPVPGLFLSNLEATSGPVFLVARTHGDPLRLAGAIRKVVHSLDPEIPIADVRTMDEYIADSVASPRFNTILVSGFAALALLLAALGILGVVSYSVEQRTHEIGIRRALGAGAIDVMRTVLARGIGLTAIGLVIGGAGAMALTRLMRTLLYGVTPSDAPTFLGVAAVLGAVAILASYLPARRAARVDPVIALRYE